MMLPYISIENIRDEQTLSIVNKVTLMLAMMLNTADDTADDGSVKSKIGNNLYS